MSQNSYCFEASCVQSTLNTPRGMTYGRMEVEVWADKDDILEALELSDEELLARVSDRETRLAVEHFGMSSILDEIGVEDTIQHFEPEVLLAIIGKDKAMDYFDIFDSIGT